MAQAADNKRQKIESFDFRPGRLLAGKYEVLSRLGKGWEEEVYKIREIDTDIERAAKIFFPERNIKNRTSAIYARKLHALRDCPIVIQYHTQETIICKSVQVTALISEYVEGELLADLYRPPERQAADAVPGYPSAARVDRRYREYPFSRRVPR